MCNISANKIYCIFDWDEFRIWPVTHVIIVYKISGVNKICNLVNQSNQICSFYMREEVNMKGNSTLWIYELNYEPTPLIFSKKQEVSINQKQYL